ncbi:type II secretion system protein N [Comamonadaceae bacterium OH2545_COT-014]|nr:type II secretion system protein N [Comamonadaceae bacterium OH2545_COT-014]
MNALRRGRRTPALPAHTGPRPPWRWAALGALLGLAIVLALQAPARWLAAAVAAASGHRVQLPEAQGTVWNGSARLLLSGGAGSRGRMALPGRVQWQLRPRGLGLHLQLRADCCTPHGALAASVAPRWGGARVTLGDATSVWPAALLTGLGTPWNTVQPEGDLALQTEAFSLQWLAGRATVDGRAQFTARQVASRLSPLKPLGSYHLTLTGGATPTLALHSLEGSALRLSGSGQWVGTRLRFTGEAQAAPGTEAQLFNLLNILGRRQGDRALISLG